MDGAHAARPATEPDTALPTIGTVVYNLSALGPNLTWFQKNELHCGQHECRATQASQQRVRQVHVMLLGCAYS
jgi:hypothetical protein